MAGTNAVWGIEVGQCALRAVKLRPADEGRFELVAFDLIEHAKILSQPDADPDELIKAAIEKFSSRNEWQKDQFVIGVPGQQTFSRFVKMPPVDAKKIPEMVRFEAGQQIPFDMNDVVWDYEVFRNEDSPDVEVGIFAMRKDLIRKQLDYFAELNIAPAAIQTIPCALYNFSRADGQMEEGGATVVIDVGAQNTDLVIVEKNSAWNRNIPLGGNNFTEALVKALKLSFAKAESLKRTAATSKYARQIFQAMRPVFTELVAEIQRSLGFYASTHRDVELKRVLACGNAFRLPGLQKYLENNLTISGGVHKLENFLKLAPSATVNAPQFSENILGFGVAYGLAIQGLGQAPISANLLPPELARIALWKKKRPYFIAAAACVGLAAAVPWVRNGMDTAALAAGASEGERAKAIVDKASGYKAQFGQASSDTTSKRNRLDKLFELQKDKALVASLLGFVYESLPELNDPQLAAVDAPDKLATLVKTNPAKYERNKRRQIILDTVDLRYFPNIDNADPPQVGQGYSVVGASGSGVMGGGRGVAGGGASPRGTMGTSGGGGGDQGGQGAQVEQATAPGFFVSISGRLLYGKQQFEAVEFLASEFVPRLKQLGQRAGMGFFVVEDDAKATVKFRNFDSAPRVVPYFPQSGGGANPMAMMGRPGATAEAAPATPVNADPVTGEDMSSDWRFELVFKVKVGEPPAPKPAAAPASPQNPQQKPPGAK